MEPRLYASAAVGYRLWIVQEGALLSITSPAVWEPDVNRGSCLAGKTHRVPASDCHCGLYAYHDLAVAEAHARAIVAANEDPADRDLLALGSLAGRGELAIHHSGWRAPEAQITGLLLTDTQAFSIQAVELAEHYRVPQFSDRNELIAHAERHAAPVPADERPPAPLDAAALAELERNYPECWDIEEVAELASRLGVSLGELYSLAVERGLKPHPF